MVDKPATRTEPIAAETGAVVEPLSTDPERGKPVVLATSLEQEFVLPGDGDHKEVHVTPAGVAVSKTDAKRVQDAATSAGVTIIQKDGN